MRGIVKTFGVIILSLYLTQQLIPTITISDPSTFVILAGLIFLASILIDPLTRILFFIPTNFFVLNLAQLFGDFMVLYFSSKSLAEFKINSFEFAGFTGFGMSIQALNLSPMQVTIAAAFLVYIISGVLRWLVD